ncbi:MAG: hypothetical protein JW800_00070 [Candidatus Omnitrophica bacterium]|nr:hypothetical protein [Candidatus Omnitrophota bacterium]
MTKQIRIIAIAALLSYALSFPPAFSQSKNDAKEIYLTTLGIDKPYEIIKLVSYRSSLLETSKVIGELKKQGIELGADYIIGIQFYSHSGYLYGTGTAVRLLEDKPR